MIKFDSGFSEKSFKILKEMDCNERSRFFNDNWVRIINCDEYDHYEDHNHYEWKGSGELVKIFYMILFFEREPIILKKISNLLDIGEEPLDRCLGIITGTCANQEGYPGLGSIDDILNGQEIKYVIEKTRKLFPDIVSILSSSQDILIKLFSKSVFDTDDLKIKKACNDLEDFNFFDFLTSSLVSTKLNINLLIINDLRSMLEDDSLKEEDFQKFFNKNPILLDPLAKEVIKKERLGKDYITDYVIKRFDGEFVVVEIEDPQKSIFLKNGNFSSDFTQAFGQILDFQRWTRDNIDYAKRSANGLEDPRGLLIMGKGKMSEENYNKLSFYRTRFRNIEILTYDEVLRKAELLLNNMYEKGGLSKI